MGRGGRQPRCLRRILANRNESGAGTGSGIGVEEVVDRSGGGGIDARSLGEILQSRPL